MKRRTIEGLIAVVAIVAVAIFAGCIESGTPSFSISELEAKSPVKYVEESDVVWGIVPVKVGGIIHNTGSKTAHDVSISFDVYIVWSDSSLMNIFSSQGTIGDIKHGESVKFELVEEVWDANMLRGAKDYNWDLSGVIEVRSNEVEWSQESNAEWMKNLFDYWVIVEDL